MNLLLDEVDVLETVGDPSAVRVRGVAHDSRLVEPGDLFCCLPGSDTDGHDHAREALSRGAVGLLCEHPVTGLADRPVVQAVVGPGRARPAMARVAAAFWGYPARDVTVAGVTGTNGKTTVAQLLGAVLGVSRPATVVGTLSGARTTPESTELQRLLADVRRRAEVGDAGGGDPSRGDPSRRDPPGAPPAVAPPAVVTPAVVMPAVVMEVSSHALVQSRVDAVHFDVAVFTNLSHEHLDFHGTMEAYFAAKASLFTPERAVRGVVNAEDPWGRRLLADARIPMVAVRAAAASGVRLEPGRSSFTWRGQRVVVAMTGAVNVHNAVLAAEAAVVLGVPPAEAAAGLAAAPPVPGRLQVVAAPGGGGPGNGGPPFVVLVDYAHTPAGLEVALGEAGRFIATGGRVVVVFGCGGDRDRSKRPLMGAVAARMAEVVVLTSDNPRSEDPAAIIEEVLAGVTGAGAAGSGAGAGTGGGAGTVVVEPDRRAAIGRAVDLAAPGDVVVVAGKGHEVTQEIGGERVPFDDRVVVTDALGASWPTGTGRG